MASFAYAVARQAPDETLMEAMVLLALMWLGMVRGYLNLVAKIVQCAAWCCCYKARTEAKSRGDAIRYRS
eukprot:2664566-Alexandrium_andersonii.AAC.1